MFSQSNQTRDNMNTEFKKNFAIGRQFRSKEELTETVKGFGKKYNVVFSIKSSSLKQGKFAYICKHGGLKRELEKNSAGIEEQESIKGAETAKKEVKRSTQKFDCPASFNLFDFTITRSNMEHNHPISQDNTTYVVNRKQPPEIMERIYTLLASGHKDPVTSVMDVSVHTVQFAQIPKGVVWFQINYISQRATESMLRSFLCVSFTSHSRSTNWGSHNPYS